MSAIDKQNTPLRMHIALQILRAWNSGTEGYCAETVGIVNKWIDGGMDGAIPWPTSPFFAEWAARKGYSKINDRFVGFKFNAELVNRVINQAVGE